MKEHKKLYKAGKLWITATLFSLIGIALTTTNVNADTTTQSDGNQQTLVINNNNTSSSSPVTLGQTEYQDSDNIQDLQNKVNDAQQKVDQAQQDVNNAQSNVESQQSVVNNDQSTLQNAQNAYQAAGGQEGSVQENISLSPDWINTVKNYLATNGSVQQVSPSSSFGQDLSNYGAALKSQNNYITDPALQNVTVSLTSDGNLDSNTELEITRYTAGLLNPIRVSLGVDPYQITQRALDDSANIAAQYSAADWTIFNHGTHDFAVLNANHFDGESLSDGYLSFDNGSTTLDNIHEAIYNSIVDMLFNDSDSDWGHMTDLAGLRGLLNGIYLGVQIDKNGQVHFNGNIAMRPGYTYSAPSANGDFVTNTSAPDTSTRIPLTASESSQTEQLKQAVQEAQDQLNQDTYTLNNYQQDLTNAQSNLQQAQQELQQAQQNLTNAQQPTTGWATDENGYKCYRDSNGNLVNGWQNIDNQWYYFNNTELVTNTIMYVPGNYAMPSGTYDFKDDGSYATNIFVMNGDKYYYFGDNGYAVTGLTQYGYNWYDFDSTYGYALTGWQDINGKRYYFDPSTKAADTGLHSDIDQYTYYFDPSNASAQKGFITIGNDLYDFGNDYTAQSGWQYDSNWDSYYFDSSYKAVSGPYTINGDMYYFDPTTHKELYGVWEYVNGGMYYFNPTPVDGLQEIDGNVYYFENNKRVDNQTLTLSGENGITGGIYSFDNNGIGKLVHTGWEKNNNNWVYIDNNGNAVDGWQYIGHQWYFFNNHQLVTNGIVHVPANNNFNGGIYLFDKNGHYFKNYFFANTNINAQKEFYYFGNDGRAKLGLQDIANSLYYFDPSTGKAVSGWKKVNNKWYYFNLSNYKALNGLQKVNGNLFYFKGNVMITNQSLKITGQNSVPDGIYYFNNNGYGKLSVKFGWEKANGKWKYINNSGILVDGWQLINKNWYYFDNNIMLANGIYYVPNNNGFSEGIYYFDNNGHYLTKTWGKESMNSTYYFGKDGRAYTNGWYNINDSWFYFNDHIMAANGIAYVPSNNGFNSGTFYFDNNGHFARNAWKQDNSGNYYYFKNDGRAYTNGWYKINGSWFYFNNCIMNANKIYHVPSSNGFNSGTFYFDNNGHFIRNAWKQDNSGNYYYFKNDGRAYTNGWYRINDVWYYFTNSIMLANKIKFIPKSNGFTSGIFAFDKNGKIMRNVWKYDNGAYYYFGNDGRAITSSWKKSGNNYYYFDSNGKTVTNGWKMISNSWFFFKANIMANTGVTSVPSYNGFKPGIYYFDHSGHYLRNTWEKHDNRYYYFGDDGRAYTNGWEKINNSWYYFNECIMITNDIVYVPSNNGFNGGTYYFDNNGHYLKNRWIIE